jgi:drug/metabolite transporter (DMT)-like permease
VTINISNRTQGILFLLAAALCWSFGGLWIKLVRLEDPLMPAAGRATLNALAVAGSRSAVAAVMMWAYLRNVRVPLTRRLLLGAVAYAGTVLFFVLATRATTAANAILLQYTAPVYVALLSNRLLGEPITRADWMTIVLVLAGMVLFFFDGLASGGMLGNLFAVISGVFFALCVIALRGERDRSSSQIVLVGNLLTAAIGLPFLIGSSPQGSDVIYLLLLGVVQLGLGYIFFVRGIRYVSAIEGALIPVIEPILNPMWVAIFAAELPSLLSAAGGLLVIGAVTARAIYQTRRSRTLVQRQVPT